MIFTPRAARRIDAGRKTQTRRLVGGVVRFNDGHRVQRPSFYKVDHDYPVRLDRREHGTFRIKILAVREERLGEITLADARAEGYRTTDEFKLEWVREHDRAWMERERVDLLADLEDGVAIVDWILLERFRRSHARRRVRVFTFEPLRDVSVFMATQRDILSGRSDGDYTENVNRAIDDAPSLTAAEHAKLNGHAAAKLDESRRQPVAYAVANYRRETEQLRRLLEETGLSDARLKRTLAQIDYHVAALEKRHAA